MIGVPARSHLTRNRSATTNIKLTTTVYFPSPSQTPISDGFHEDALHQAISSFPQGFSRGRNCRLVHPKRGLCCSGHYCSKIIIITEPGTWSKTERLRQRGKGKKNQETNAWEIEPLSRTLGDFFPFFFALVTLFFLWSCAGTNQWITDTRNQTLQDNVGWDVFYSRTSSSSLVSARSLETPSLHPFQSSLGPAASLHHSPQQDRTRPRLGRRTLEAVLVQSTVSSFPRVLSTWQRSEAGELWML